MLVVATGMLVSMAKMLVINSRSAGEKVAQCWGLKRAALGTELHSAGHFDK